MDRSETRARLQAVRGWIRARNRALGRSIFAWLGRHAPSPRQVLVVSISLVTILWVLWQRCGVMGCPNVERLNSYQPGNATILLDRDGHEYADLAPVRHVVVPVDSLPPYVKAAFVSVEDKRFYEHHGVDARRILGALVADLRAGSFVQGFSTITMQLARNVWHDRLPGEQKTLKRKILEIRVARDIERHFTKDQILGLYLNQINFGEGAFGIEAASRNYFGKHATELTLDEAATLAAIPKSPVNYDPRRHASRARARRDLILSLMAAQGRIPRARAERAERVALDVVDDPPDDRTAERRELAPYFAEVVRRQLEDRLGDEIYTAPLRVYTTLDRTAEAAAEQELKAQLRRIERGVYGRFEGARCRPAADTLPENCLEGAMVVMAAATGDVLALVGGRDYDLSAYNRATNSRRQPGSAFKPFVYAAALSDGYAPSQHIKDTPLRMELKDGEVWEPKNYSGTYEGEVTLRQALVHSINVPTIRLAAAVGLGNVARIAHRAGIRTPIPEVPSMALGTAGVTPLDLTAAYTAFAAQGNAAQPRFVLRVEDADGNVVWRDDVDTHRVLSPEVAYLVTSMLSDAVDEGTGVEVRDVGFHGPVAGKTGTTNDGADAWFVGYTPDVVGTVWIGFDRPRAIVARATGGRLAAPVWGRVMRTVYRHRAEPDPWPRPEDVVRARVDPASGLILPAGCEPLEGSPGRELFIKGSQPATTCPQGEPETTGETLGDRVVAWGHLAWAELRRWVVRHFGREEPAHEPETRDRYLGAPRLPQEDELPPPPDITAPDSFEVPDFQTPPVILPALPETIPPLPDTGETVPPDTVPILTPTDSGPVLVPMPAPRRTGAPPRTTRDSSARSPHGVRRPPTDTPRPPGRPPPLRPR